ncbi:hypothetical protein B0X71_06815 [Planococcus lenghuensis]|uniref:Uncharacterized protein n=1 Tax=Planococcus lenghuensis TaxID=2213202 RepID=A0A1Q2KYF0_9BACL|nr:hypothetical protein B0X71_06815 [Planococcus lenghuensis]
MPDSLPEGYRIKSFRSGQKCFLPARSQPGWLFILQRKHSISYFKAKEKAEDFSSALCLIFKYMD